MLTEVFFYLVLDVGGSLLLQRNLDALNDC